LQIKCNYRHYAPSAGNCLWHLLTLALNISETDQPTYQWPNTPRADGIFGP